MVVVVITYLFDFVLVGDFLFLGFHLLLVMNRNTSRGRGVTTRRSSVSSGRGGSVERGNKSSTPRGPNHASAGFTVEAPQCRCAPSRGAPAFGAHRLLTKLRRPAVNHGAPNI